MKKIELFILIAILIFCGIHVSKTTMDFTLTTRNLVWCFGITVLFLMIMSRSGDVDFSILKRMIFPILCGLLIVSIFSITKAANKGEGWYEVARLFTQVVTLFVAAIIISENNKNVLFKFILLLSLGLGGYGIYQFFEITNNPAARTGTMANMNLCSSAHVLMIPFSIYAIFRYSKIWKILGFVSVAIALFIVFYSLRTRSAWVALFIAGTVATLHRKKLAIVMLISFVVLGIGIYLIKGPAVLNADSMKQRADMWGQSLNMFKDHPLGVGAGNWRVAIPYYSRNMSEKTRAVAFKTVYFQRPHNGWIWKLTELGIFGIILYISFFAMGLYYAIRARSVLMYSVIAAYVVVAVFSFPGERAFHTLFLLLIMASSLALYHKKQPVKVNARLVYVCSVLVMIGLSFALVNFGIRYRTEQSVFKALHARKAQDWNAILKHIGNISQFSTLDSFATPLAYYQGIGYFQKKDYGCALAKFEEALKESPNHIFVQMQLATCLAIHQRVGEAQKIYERITEMYPGYLPAQQNLAAVKTVAKGKNK